MENNNSAKALWPNSFTNKYPVTKRELEKKLNHEIQMEPLKNLVELGLSTLAGTIPVIGVAAGVTTTVVFTLAKSKKTELTNLLSKMQANPSRYTGFRYVQKYDAGPIYGYWTTGSSYYEIY